MDTQVITDVKNDLRDLHVQITQLSNRINAMVESLPRGALRFKATSADIHLLAAREYIQKLIVTEFP